MSDVFIAALTRQTQGMLYLPPFVSKAVRPGLVVAPPVVKQFGGTTLKSGKKVEWVHFYYNGSKRLPGALLYATGGEATLWFPNGAFVVRSPKKARAKSSCNCVAKTSPIRSRASAHRR